VVPDTEYNYRVKAVGMDGDSAYAGPVTETTPTGPATGMVSFEADEGYVLGNLDGQPASNPIWSVPVGTPDMAIVQDGMGFAESRGIAVGNADSTPNNYVMDADALDPGLMPRGTVQYRWRYKVGPTDYRLTFFIGSPRNVACAFRGAFESFRPNLFFHGDGDYEWADPDDWNLVELTLDFATETYLLTINGATRFPEGKPFYQTGANNIDFILNPQWGGVPSTVGYVDDIYVVNPTPLPHPGDATEDGMVDGADYTIWADNYGKSDADPWSAGGWTVGNFTEDTNVDGADYTIWADEYGYGTGGAGSGDASSMASVSSYVPTVATGRPEASGDLLALALASPAGTESALSAGLSASAEPGPPGTGRLAPSLDSAVPDVAGPTWPLQSQRRWWQPDRRSNAQELANPLAELELSLPLTEVL
jgi:hypothetical protein